MHTALAVRLALLSGKPVVGICYVAIFLFCSKQFLPQVCWKQTCSDDNSVISVKQSSLLPAIYWQKYALAKPSV